jgi:hypothetical protein
MHGARTMEKHSEVFLAFDVAKRRRCQPTTMSRDFELSTFVCPRVRMRSAERRAVCHRSSAVPILGLASVTSMLGAQGLEPWTR